MSNEARVLAALDALDAALPAAVEAGASTHCPPRHPTHFEISFV
jgi:hypothetical protein